MENPSTVGEVVNALIHTYLDALECYTAWRQKRCQENHYRTRDGGGSSSNSSRNSSSRSSSRNEGANGSGFCAVRASLSISRLKIKEAYEGGVDVFGDEFATRDDLCRPILQDNFALLRARTDALRRAAADTGDCVLELHEVVSTSEAVRVACLAALSKHYQRVAVGRLVPRAPSRAQRQSWLDVSEAEETTKTVILADDTAQPTQCLASSRVKSAFHSELPSPPPTPKMGYPC